MSNLDKEEVKWFFFRFNDEDKERYASKFVDWFNGSMMLDDARRRLIADNLPLFLLAYELGLYANNKYVMAIRKLAMELPA